MIGANMGKVGWPQRRRISEGWSVWNPGCCGMHRCVAVHVRLPAAGFAAAARPPTSRPQRMRVQEPRKHSFIPLLALNTAPLALCPGRGRFQQWEPLPACSMAPA